MKKFLRVFFISLLMSILLMAFLAGLLFLKVLWSNKLQYYTTSLNREFYNLIEKDRPNIDLNKITSVDWDQMVFLGPYENICNYGINGYEKGSSDCYGSDGDGECWILLVKNNKLVGTTDLNRTVFDLTTVKDLPDRLDKSKAQFTISKTEDWNVVELKE